MKCQYCGSELILLPDGLSLKFRSEMTCPKCGATNEKSSWFCSSCHTILTNDIEMLKELKKKLTFEQDRVKSFLPDWALEKLEPEEFIYFTVNFRGEEFYAVTDKRIMKNKGGDLWEVKLTDVVSIGVSQFRAVPGFFAPSVKGGFEVVTFQGSILFDGWGPGDSGLCGVFCSWVRQALNNHNLRKKDVRALLVNLPLTEEVDKKEIGEQKRTFGPVSCGNCIFFGKPALCKSHEKDRKADPCSVYRPKE